MERRALYDDGTGGGIKEFDPASGDTLAGAGALPTGTVIMTARTTAPSGFLSCDGSAVSRVTYANLFSAIGTTYGAGNGSTTFNVPDIRGLFPRGAGAHGTMTKATGGAFDGGSVGATSNDQMQGHRHNRSPNGYDEYIVDTGGGGHTIPAGGLRLSNAITTGNPVTDTTNGTPRTGSETKPASMSLLYCIKF